MASQPSSATTRLIANYLQTLQTHTSTNAHDDPNYHSSNPQTLITTSQPIKFSLGNGAQILSSTLPTCLSTNHELIFVTCFWAKSSSQATISQLLLNLSHKALSQNRKIRVRICFSSLSLTQKLFQTASLDGKIYPPSSWFSLGLPKPEKLEGLEMVVKSIFVRPFSVMHPKFILVDRKMAFMPSCNVSWESWFEGCVEMRGDICSKLLEFWEAFWSRGSGSLPPLPPTEGLDSGPPAPGSSAEGTSLINQTPLAQQIPITTILLPSPHHRNPHFFSRDQPPPPPTPLNILLLHLLTTVTKSIFIQTPNLTSYPFISAIFAAMQRGISIHIITSSRLMILEQLVTAGTITEFEVWKLRRRYRRLLNTYEKGRKGGDAEVQLMAPGTLTIGYYHAGEAEKGVDEPVKSHLKLTIVDEEVVVLGSGNMDRASWYTSQELGVTFFDREMAKNIRGCVDEGLVGRVSYVC